MFDVVRSSFDHLPPTERSFFLDLVLYRPFAVPKCEFGRRMGEEEGLVGAHSFMTQHPWRKSFCAAVDLEAMGVGGKTYLFQVLMVGSSRPLPKQQSGLPS